MKQFLLLLCLAVFTGGLSAQVYVNSAAADGGDGATWATAYNSLSDALTEAPSGAELWVAAGTYTTPADSSFFIAKELTVLGGFDGTETAADAADPAANATILSGDVMGNDGATYDSLAYADNNRVLTIVDTSSVASMYTVTLDGLTITNGGIAVNIPDSMSIIPSSGAGIMSSAKLLASRLTFNKNRSFRGSALALFSLTANESELDSLSLDGNYSGVGRQVYLNGVDGAVVKNSTFNNDEAVEQGSGFIQVAFANGFTVENCGFAGMNTSGTGGGLRFDDGVNLTVDNCTFENMTASFGGGALIVDAQDIAISNCTFESVTSTSSGGGIYVGDTQGVEVSDCTFEDMAASVGGGLVSFDSDDIAVRSSTFNNMTMNRGAIYHQQAADLVTDAMDADDFIIADCSFTNCTVTERGAAVTAFNTNIQISNTMITDNSAGGIGGGMYMVPIDNRDYVMALDNVTFANNTDGGAGGAICLLVFGTAHVEGTISNSTFEENQSPGGSGGALYLQGLNDFTISNSAFDKNVGGFGTILTRGVTGLTLNNVDFTENGTGADSYQGAGIVGYFDDNSAGLMIDSCNFVNNSVGDFGTITSGGGAIYALGGSAKTIPVEISNTSFRGNGATAEQAGGAMYLISGFALTIENSEFVDNSAAGDGGALNARIGVASRDTVGDVITLNYEPWDAAISNTKFVNSSSGNQGGAISTQRLGIDFTNCVFVNNLVGGAGSGGAIIFNGNAPGIDADGNIVNIGAVQIEAAFVNNTFVDNAKGDGEGAVGASLAIFQPGDTESTDSNSMKITLTNNAFLSTDGSESPAIEVELGASEPGGFVAIGDLFFESLGGNYFNAENGPEVDLGMNGDVINEDLQEEDVIDLFIDILDDLDEGVNAQLDPGMDFGASNPLIDGGVINALTPDTDLDGFPRGVTYDIGAYEVDGNLTETNEPVENSGLELTFYPNPTIGELNIQNDDASISSFKVVVSDQAGRILQAANFNGVSNRMDFSSLPMGVYNLQLYVNGSVYSKQIVKQ